MVTTTATVPLARIRDRLRAFDFVGLFNEARLGLPPRRHYRRRRRRQPTSCAVLPQKRGFQVFCCPPGADGAIPNRQTRRRIDRRSRRAPASTCSSSLMTSEPPRLWQWVARKSRESRLQPHEHELRRAAIGERLWPRGCQASTFSLEDEESLTVPDVAGGFAVPLRRRARHQALLRAVSAGARGVPRPSSRASPPRATATGTPR